MDDEDGDSAAPFTAHILGGVVTTLWVNNRVAASGMTDGDTVDLAPYLVRGRNQIRMLLTDNGRSATVTVNPPGYWTQSQQNTSSSGGQQWKK